MLVALALLASGCLRFQGDLSVSGDDRVSGTMVFAFKIPDGAPPTDPIDPADEPEDLPADLRDKVKVESYAEDGYEGVRITLDRLTFEQLDRLYKDGADSASASGAPGLPGGLGRPTTRPGSAPATPGPASALALRRDGDRVVLFGQFFFPTYSLLGGPTETEGFEARMRVTFPGDVISSNGRQEGRTVTWDLRPSTLEIVRASAYAGSGSGGAAGWLLWGGGAALALLLAGGLGLLWMRRRRPAVAGVGGGPWPGPAMPGWSWPPPGPGGPGPTTGPGPTAGPRPAAGRDDWIWARPEAGERPGLGTLPSYPDYPAPDPPPDRPVDPGGTEPR